MGTAANGFTRSTLATQGMATPFVDAGMTDGFAPAPVAPRVPVGPPFRVSSPPRVASPFRSDRELEDELSPWNPASEIVDETLASLHDEVFDEVIHDLVGEAAAMAVESRRGDYGDAGRAALRAHQVLADRFHPLAADAERLLGEVAEAAKVLDLSSASEAEIDAALEPMRPRVAAGAPAFEQFLGSLFRKAKSLVHGAAKIVGKGIKAVASVLPIGLLLGKLASFVRPLLSKVIAFAVDKLPPQYRALAGQVAQRFGIASKITGALGQAAGAIGLPATALTGMLPTAFGSPDAPAAAAPVNSAPSASTSVSGTASAIGAPAPDAAGDADGADATTELAAPDTSMVQGEIDAQLTELLLASDEGEADEIASEYIASARAPASDPTGDLDAARTRFVRELESLGEGEDATPAVEHFLPALLPVLRMAIGAAGRDRVVDFFGGLAGQLIAPVVGPGVAPALGKAIVDTGMRTFLQAEVAAPAELHRVGAEAVARTVEDAARHVGALPAHVLGHPALLESHAREAFDRAAAANLPGSLLRPEHREGVDRGAWAPLPRAGRPYYKRYSHVFDVTLTPALAGSIPTFGGGTLASFVREQLRLTLDRPLHARVHLFEILPGGRLSHVAAGESLPALGTPHGRRMFHPLTPEVAGALLHHPRLGRRVAGGADPLRSHIGERVYYLEVEGAPRRVVDAPSRVHVSLDLVRDEARVCIFLGETLAQQIASMVRGRARAAAIVHELRTALASHARSLSAEGGHRRVHVIGGGGGALHHRHHASHVSHVSPLRRAIARASVEWAWARLAELFERSSADFVHAVESSPPGVTLRVTFEHAPGLAALRAAGKGGGTGLPVDWPPAVTPPAKIDVKPGHEH